MIIYGGTLSPFVRKAVVFAIEKGIDFELVQAFENFKEETIKL